MSAEKKKYIFQDTYVLPGDLVNVKKSVIRLGEPPSRDFACDYSDPGYPDCRVLALVISRTDGSRDWSRFEIVFDGGRTGYIDVVKDDVVVARRNSVVAKFLVVSRQ